MGGVKCQPFLKHSNHWKRALKMIFKRSGCFQFPEAVVTSTANESLRSTEVLLCLDTDAVAINKLCELNFRYFTMYLLISQQQGQGF